MQLRRLLVAPRALAFLASTPRLDAESPDGDFVGPQHHAAARPVEGTQSCHFVRLNSFGGGELARLTRKHGFGIRFHVLRHTHASQLLKAGVPLKVVSERLGHATASITLDVYSHVPPGMQAEAVAKIDAALGEGGGGVAGRLLQC